MQESRWSMLLTLLSNPQSRSIWCRGFLEARWDSLSLSHTRPIRGNLLKFWIFKILKHIQANNPNRMLEKTASMLQGFAQKELKCKAEGMQRFCKLVRLMQCCHLDFAQRLGLSEEYHGTSHCRMSRESNWMLSIVVSRNEIWRAPGTPWLEGAPQTLATHSHELRNAWKQRLLHWTWAVCNGRCARCCQTPETF